jgi:hypothetical protein
MYGDGSRVALASRGRARGRPLDRRVAAGDNGVVDPADEPKVVPVKRAGRWAALSQLVESFGFPRAMAFCAWTLLVVSTYGSLAGTIGEGELTLFGLVTLRTVPLLLAVLVALPNVALFIIARMIVFRFSRRSFTLVFRGEAGEVGPVPATARSQAQWMWIYERSLAQRRYESGLLPQVAVFGLLSSATLAFCVLGIHLPASQLFPNMTQIPTVAHLGRVDGAGDRDDLVPDDDRADPRADRRQRRDRPGPLPTRRAATGCASSAADCSRA